MGEGENVISFEQIKKGRAEKEATNNASEIDRVLRAEAPGIEVPYKAIQRYKDRIKNGEGSIDPEMEKYIKKKNWRGVIKREIEITSELNKNDIKKGAEELSDLLSE